MSSLSMFQQGSFTSDGTSQRINLQGGADYFVVTNLNEATATGTDSIDDAFKWEWFDVFPEGTTQVYYKANAAHTVLTDSNTARKMVYQATRPTPEAAVTGTDITAANPAVAHAVAHGYAVGDRVVIYNNVDMKQIGGLEFTITAIGDADHFTLGFLDASGFAAAESAFAVRRIAPELEVLPGAKFITGITQASNAVVEMAVDHNFVVGDIVYFRVPSDFGMVELDGLQGEVLSIDKTTANTNTITVDINSTGFTAFAFPTSGSVPIKFAMVGLQGKRGLYDDWFSSTRSLLDLNPYRAGLDVPYMFLRGGAGLPGGANAEVVVWQAYRSV